MKDLTHKQTLGLVITTAILCGLFAFSSFVGEYLYSKVEPKETPLPPKVETVIVPSGRDTVYFDMCSSCVHFETCLKCQKYEQELINKGMINP
jgi:hypothetical protein